MTNTKVTNTKKDNVNKSNNIEIAIDSDILKLAFDKLRNTKKTLASVESLTGGLFATVITSMPEASKIFKGTLVSYATEVKEKFGVNVENGVINKEVALEMAEKGKEYFGVDVCVSFTGNAGPDLMEGMPSGRVFIAINDEVFKKTFNGNRESVRNQCVNFVLKKIYVLDI